MLYFDELTKQKFLPISLASLRGCFYFEKDPYRVVIVGNWPKFEDNFHGSPTAIVQLIIKNEHKPVSNKLFGLLHGLKIRNYGLYLNHSTVRREADWEYFAILYSVCAIALFFLLADSVSLFFRQPKYQSK